MRKSQKCKKYSQTVSLFCDFGIWGCKSYTEMLVKLTTGVNFINISLVPFCMKVFCAAFLLLQFGCAIFCQKNIGAKAACKMLIKLTTGGPPTFYLQFRILGQNKSISKFSFWLLLPSMESLGE